MVDQGNNGDGQTIPDFGGHPLGEVAGLQSHQLEALQRFGFSDAEQVVAVVAIPGVMDHFMAATGLSKEQTDDLVSKLRDVVPAIAAAADTTEFALGALPPTAEIDALGAAADDLPHMAGPLPPSVNHIALMPEPKQQGSRGTCVSFAMTAVHEFHLRTTSNQVEDLSEQFLYHQTKLIDGQPAICGTWQVKAAQVLQNAGHCPESVWPYNGNLPCNNNGVEPADALAAAAARKLVAVVLPPKDVIRIKQQLAAGSVVGFSIPVYNSWFLSSETKRTGRITMRIGNEAVSAGHAMCLVGYQDDSNAPGGGFFIVRNSWFGSWGGECPYGSGYGTIPYGYIATDNWEAVSTDPPAPASA